MNILLWIAIVLGVIYGILNMIVGFSQIGKNNIQIRSSIGMLVSGLAIVLAMFLSTYKVLSITLLIVGLIAIHILTLINGYRLYGKINIKHHIIRFILSAIIVVLFILGI